jgi:N-acyl homoserine lactone hydrolase
VSDIDVRRVDFGYFVRPAEETGTGSPRVEPCLGYVVQHPHGTLLFDTGMGSAPEVDAHYRPRRTDLRDVLSTAGLALDEVRLVSNCHLHFDHCGGNPLLGDRPVFVQRVELEEARSAPDYTLPELVAGDRHEPLDGSTEVVAGVFLTPTPGHTAGHQSLVVRRRDGVVIVAGQSHDTATSYSADVLALRARQDSHGGPLPTPPEWLAELQALDPKAVFFAHDHSVWRP